MYWFELAFESNAATKPSLRERLNGSRVLYSHTGSLKSERVSQCESLEWTFTEKRNVYSRMYEEGKITHIARWNRLKCLPRRGAIQSALLPSCSMYVAILLTHFLFIVFAEVAASKPLYLLTHTTTTVYYMGLYCTCTISERVYESCIRRMAVSLKRPSEKFALVRRFSKNYSRVLYV